MRRVLYALCVAALAALWILGGTEIVALEQAATVAEQPLPQPYLALVNANVLDVRTGTIRNAATVVLRGGQIVSVDNSAPPAAAQVMDLEGRYLLPGFMDGHYHSRSLAGARRAVESGVTTVKSASVGGFSDIALRELSQKGFIPGPDVLAAGAYVMPQGLGESALGDPRLFKLFSMRLDRPEDIRLVIQVDADRGVDWIKTRSTDAAGSASTDPREQVFTEEQMKIIVDEATRHNLPVSCHAQGDVGIQVAARAGVKTIEHGSYMSEAGLQVMKEKGTVWNPTFTSVIDMGEPHNDYENITTENRAPYMIWNMRRLIPKAHKMGIPVITSTDTTYGPESTTRLYKEISNFVEMGLTPLEALQSATIVSARVYGLEKKTGAVEPGLEADLVVFDRNPLTNILAVHDPVLVISNGRIALNRPLIPARPGRVPGE